MGTESYIYDWNEQWSNDPDIGCPPMGCRIELDGEDISDLPVLRCVTGQNGHVEIIKETGHGPVIIMGRPDRYIRRGHVDVYFPNQS